jgi:hypothetical protein
MHGVQLLSLEQFAACVNETFVAALNDGTVNFTLVEARPLPTRARDAARAPFSLLFLNTAPVLFPQQIYAMRHPRLGDIGIFLVPIAQNRDGFVYEAVFN